MAINDRGFGAQLFVSNVFDGTVTCVDVTFDNGGIAVRDSVKIGSGDGFGPDSAAVVVGPAGLAYDAFRDTLFVASEMDDTIFALQGAGHTQTDLGRGAVVYQDAAHLHGPLGLIFSRMGTSWWPTPIPRSARTQTNRARSWSSPGAAGSCGSTRSIPNLGSAFALGIVSHDDSKVFAYVDDFLSTCTILNLSEGVF